MPNYLFRRSEFNSASSGFRCFSVGLGFVLLYFENYIYLVSPKAKASAEFDKTILSDKHRKIIILRSSYVGRINATLLNDYLELYGKPVYSVYNLARSSDLPKIRLKEIYQIISMRPDLVICGVGFRDFEKQVQSRPQNLLPNIQEELMKNLSLDHFVAYDTPSSSLCAILIFE